MKYITRMLAGIALGCCGSMAHAVSIQSMTIEEIGVASGGLGTSAVAGGGGYGDWMPASGPYTPASAFFVSAGSTDASMIMGVAQGNGEFTLGAVWGRQSVLLNTLHGAPSGSIASSMSLKLTGLFADLPTVDLTFNIAPDAGTLITAVSAIDASHYYYTADWTHLVNDDVYHLSSGIAALGWNGSTVLMHLEGVATLAPVPEAETYAMMLTGLGLIGFMAHRRRKSV